MTSAKKSVLKRIVVIDVGEGPYVLINPRITKVEGEQVGDEGCLSLPGKVAVVPRPYKVTCVAYDEDMEEYEIEAEDLFARAICHELDHLEGILYIDKATEPVRMVTEE